MKVLFVEEVHPILEARLTEAGFDCEIEEDITKDQFLNIIPEFEGIIIRSKFPLNAEVLTLAKNLKFIGRSGAGLENIDLDFAKSKGIEIFNAPEGNQLAVAEHCLGMILGLINQMHTANIDVRNGLWQREANRGKELSNMTVGIVGFGHMGSAFAKVLRGIGCKILAYDKYKTNYAPSYVSEVNWDEFTANSDVVSLHIPLASDTKGWFNIDTFNSFKKPFYLINSARGKVVNTQDLLEVLKTKQIIGACLDVIEFESKSFSTEQMMNNTVFQQLCDCDNVTLSPHVAGWTTESYKKLSSVLADKILAWYQSA